VAQIRVFVADDHELVRYALRMMIDAEPDMEVIGEAADTDGAIVQCTEAAPDVLMLDLRMPGDGGIEVCRRVHEALPETQILVLTSFDEDEGLFGVLSAGAAGYLLKDTRPERIIHAIRAVSDGQAVFDSDIANRIISGRPKGNEDLDEPLSDREMEVLQLIAEGLSNKDIAHRLWIGETTVKTHVSHILHKLGQGDRTQAVLAAVRAGIVELGQ